MNLARTVIATTLAVAVIFGLFFFMHRLISSGGDNRAHLEAIARIDFSPVEIPDEVTIRQRRKPPRPTPGWEQPAPHRIQISRIDQVVQQMPQINAPNLDVALFGDESIFIGDFQQVNASLQGDIIPVVVIRPLYPREAALGGIEGWVKVEFTITEVGTVRDPQVIAANPERVFNREAIRAILKWKFKPRVVDGVAVERRATQVIEFSLHDPEGV